MAKKKKPAGNPARGFATTSVASKSKPEKAIDAEPKTSEKEDAAIPHPGSQLSDATAPPPQTQQDLTPEEFEAQLERDELQLLVEKHAAKVRRESRRQLTKFQTDRRVLRSQSHSMTVGDWVPDKVMDEIIRLAQAESNDSNRRQGQDSLLKILSEEDAMSRLWTLDLILRDLGFSQDHIQPVLKWLCANAVNVDATNSPWGFQEALEWLALDQCEGHAFSYEDNKPKQLVTNSPSPSRPGRQLHRSLFIGLLLSPRLHSNFSDYMLTVYSYSHFN
ncbi:hypothetical protein BDV95DRAFT_968 [Massariosphaeria phaeospora]|uniref:Uncharacterized protein n=1 Tax=Massariosphaeria phaeospora TaxID=100035 RepID=A0A7C8IHI8_9PLEO|nr:hypothetical protein BDV95DRAFT_968 [Massariosphaeria phaeospora]